MPKLDYIEPAKPDPTAKIIRLHGLIKEFGEALLAAAITVGQLLTEQKARLGHKGFLPWIKANLPFTDRTARNYMKLYRGRDRLEAAGVKGIRDAYRLLTGPAGEGKSETDSDLNADESNRRRRSRATDGGEFTTSALDTFLRWRDMDRYLSRGDLGLHVARFAHIHSVSAETVRHDLMVFREMGQQIERRHTRHETGGERSEWVWQYSVGQRPMFLCNRMNALREEQVRILEALSNVKDSLSSREIAEALKAHPTGLIDYIGLSSLAKWDLFEANTGIVSLLAFGYVHETILNIDGKDVRRYEITAAGRKALKDREQQQAPPS